MVAVRVPTALGSNVTTKLVLPLGAMVALGGVVIWKFAACVPEVVIPPEMVRVRLPLLVITKVRGCVPEVSATEPKSVPSEDVGLASPSAMLLPSPLTATSTYVPVPCTRNVYGFLALDTLLVNSKSANATPLVEGLNSTWNVVVSPAAREDAGCAVTTKLVGLPPAFVYTLPIPSVAVPELVMVKVLVRVPPATNTSE
jgi:hypothetical protein